jgi:hypothetical protein
MVGLAALLATAAFAAVPAAASAQTPLRHLVYNFDVTLTSNIEMQNYSGTSSGGNLTGDRGQIVVDVLQVQPDQGLVVRISENARETRSAEPAMCVTYGTGQFVCDPNKKVNDEEIALLRILGKNFVNSAQIDAKGSWTYGTTSPAGEETSKYHIDADKAGMLDISFTRQLQANGPQSASAETEGKIVYNQNLNVPVSESEDTVTREESGQNYNRLEQQVTLNLATDSMQGQASTVH